MKLRNLIKLHENNSTDYNIIASPFFRELYAEYNYNINFKFLGVKNEEYIFVAPIENFGMFNMIISDAKIYAKITEKSAIFGIVYTLTGLEKFEATVIAMTNKNGDINIIPFDNSDKKTFSDKATDFLGLETEG
jgi:hypothetical protein